MSDQRNLTLGVQFDADRPISQLSEMMGAIREIKTGFQSMEEDAGSFGSQVSQSVGVAVKELESVGAAGEDVRQLYQEMGASAESFGTQASESAGAAIKELESIDGIGEDVRQSYREMGASAESFSQAAVNASARAITETNSLTKTIQAGFQGAYGFAEKKIKSFGTKVKTGASQVKQAVLHPIQTVKSALSEALQSAEKELGQTGDEAERTGDKLRDMGENGEGAGGRIRDSIGSAVKSFFAISAGIELVKAGIEAVKRFAGSIINAGVEAEQTGAKFKAMFDVDSGVGEWAENFADAVHRSGKEVESFLVSNKKMYQELGITGQAADELSKITTSLAYDLGTAFKMDDSEALGVVQEYINGNASALSEYGIQIDDLILKQSAMAMGLGSNIEALDNAAMAQVRMNALLENSASIQQAAAKKQEGYANGIKSLKGIWNDFLSSAGEKFSPVFTSLTNTILTSWPQVEPALMGMVELLGNGLAAGTPVIAELAGAALPSLIQTIGDLFTAAAPLGGVMLGLATSALPPLVSAAAPLVSTFGMLAQTVLPPLSRIIGNIATSVVPPLVSILKSLSENVIAPLMPHVESLASAVLPALSSGLNLIPPVLQVISPILSGIADVLSRVVGFLGRIAEWSAGGLGTLLDKARSFLGVGTSVQSSGSTVSRTIPHNADGDNNFKGGWTHINERGGELAFLPSGSAIIPADKSEQIINNSRSTNMVVSVPFSPTIHVEVSGNPDSENVASLKEELKQTIKELWQEMKEEDTINLAIQQGNA